MQRFRSFDGTEIAYTVRGKQGSRRTAILVNGLCCDATYWKYLLPELDEVMRVVTYDLRGHGVSGAPAVERNVRIEDNVRDLVALMDHLRLKKATIIGFSLGVQILFEACRSNQDRFDAVIAVTGPFENPLATFYGLRIPGVIWDLVIGGMIKIEPLTSTVWHKIFTLRLTHTVARLLGSTGASYEDMKGFYDHNSTLNVPAALGMALASTKHSARDVLPKIRVPALVIGGTHDLFTPLGLSAYMRDNIPGCQFVQIEKGTHTTLLEQPRRVNDAILGFLSAKRK